MSDREFDNYLALLAKLLRLDGQQREAIAGELRAHLEDRLDELLARGVPRDEAVKLALEEFGDAAGLAAEFGSISRNRRRRWLMRVTTFSAAAIVLVAAGSGDLLARHAMPARAWPPSWLRIQRKSNRSAGRRACKRSAAAAHGIDAGTNGLTLSLKRRRSATC